MIRFVRDWVDHRTGLGKLIDAMLLEHIPGGARWRYVWGSALAIVFSIQLITGVLLMTAYSPGDTTAWSSVYFIQYEMDFGWLIRGLHHFGSQTMVVLLGIHMLQVVIAGAHLKPREVNWWLGLGLAGVVLGLSLTGYLLPWDQKGFYATQVATNIAGGIPGVGSFMQKVVVGGSSYGNHTLTRFFSLHVAILPGLMIALLAAHIWVFRRHGVTTAKNPNGSGWFWPDQAFRDMFVGIIIFGIMLGLVVYGWGNKIEPKPNADGTVVERSTWDKIAHAGKDGRGAHLDAPADPNVPYPARPEWYFLSLFQLLKYFEGPKMLIGTVGIPAAIGGILFLLPFFGFGRFRGFGRFVGTLAVLALIVGVFFLTAQAWMEDQKLETIEKPPYKQLNQWIGLNRYDAEKGKAFQHQLEEADKRAKRAVQLAAEGSPAAGGRYLLPNDPMTAGKQLFKERCATCHNYHDAEAEKKEEQWMNAKPTAADLTDWGSAKWLKGLLLDADHPSYFGATHLKGGKMAKYVAQERGKNNPALNKDLDQIAEWLATKPRKKPAKDEQGANADGYKLFDKNCSKCHSFAATPGNEMDAPDLAGYGDGEWLRGMLVTPADTLKYGLNNRMPAFRDQRGDNAAALAHLSRAEKAAALAAALVDVTDDKKKADIEAAAEKAHQVMHLTDLERELIIRFLTKDDRVVFGGEPTSGPPVKK